MAIHRTRKLADLVLDGFRGDNSLDAGLLRRPTYANGNRFARPPRVENFENFLS